MPELPSGNPRIPEGINAKNENPFTEFAQLLLGVLAGFAVLLLLLVLTVNLLAPLIPFSWESKVEPLVAQYLQGDGEAVEPAAQQALAKLGAALVQAHAQLEIAGDEQGVPVTAYRFHLINSNVANAFATLGGHIIVTDALVRQVRSENGLSMVIAHEIAHIHHRHPIAGVSRALVLQLALYALMGSSGDGPLGHLLSGSSMLALLNFNREMESEADERALEIVMQHYKTLRGADEFFASMATSDNTALWLEFAQTHPNSERRLEVIQRRQAISEGRELELTLLPEALVITQDENSMPN